MRMSLRSLLVCGGLALVVAGLFWMVSPTASREEKEGRTSVTMEGNGIAPAMPKTDSDAASFSAYEERGRRLETLPASLEGTQVDGRLQVDADGNLIVSIGVRRVFDYFLSALGEEDLDTIKARIAAHLAGNLPDGKAVQQAWALLDRYLNYQDALSQQPKPERTAAGARDAVKARQQLRHAWLGQQVAEVFFGFEDQLDSYTIRRLEILENDQLSDAQKRRHIAMLQQELPAPIREARERATAPTRVAGQVETLREAGASAAEIRALREQQFGVEAAQRLEQLDRQRQQWDARYQDYASQRQQILESGLASTDQQAAIERLQEDLFSEQEQRRVQALDRIAAQRVEAQGSE